MLILTRQQEIAGVLENMIALIETYGWVQGHMGSVDEGFCVVGALSFSCSSDYYTNYWLLDNVKMEINKTLRNYPEFCSRSSWLQVWNDSLRTTKEEVLFVLEQTLKEIQCSIRTTSK